MPIVAAAVVAAGSIYGGISGAAAKKAQLEAAQQAAAQAAAQYDGIIPPDVKALIVTQLKKQGVYSPEMEDAISAGESNYKAITENKDTVQAQQNALQQMIGVSRTGLQASDRAALNKVRNENARDVEGKNQQILQQMQARGLSGSGNELAMQIANSQSGADLASQQSDALAAQAQQNALKAISDSSNMASQSRGDDFKVTSAKASAEDEMNRFNVANQRDVAANNVNSRNQAQAANLQESQRIYEQNIANNRAEQLRQEDAKQQRFQNQMNVAAGRANALNHVATNDMAIGKSQAESAQGIGSGLGQMGGAVAQMIGSSGGSSGADSAGGTTSMSSDYLNGSDDNAFAFGGKVPGKAKVPGNSPMNDTVSAKLSPGEVVIPRSVVAHPSAIPSFIKKAKASPKEKEQKGPSDEEVAHHVIQSNALLHSLMSRLAKKGQ